MGVYIGVWGNKWRWCSGNTTILLPTCSLSFPISSFSQFWFYFCTAVWRPFQAMNSSNLISLERSGCLISLGSGLAGFGVTFIKISHLEERWRSIGNSTILFLKNLFTSICGRYHRALFMRDSQDVILQSCSDGLPQLLLNWYNFLLENDLKQPFLNRK